MKTFVLYSIFLVTTTYGQGVSNNKIRCEDCRRAARSSASNRVFLTVSAGESYLFYPKSNGLLNVSFPYIVTSKNETSLHTFTATVSNPYSKPFGAFNLDFQLGAKNHFFDFELGVGGSMSYFSFGYGRKVNGLEARRNLFSVKPSINLGFYEFTNPVGSIDNQGKIVTVFGDEADSTFRTRIGVHSPLRTYNAKYIDVQYVQDDFILHPRIAFEYHPFKSLFFVELSLSYFLPISELAHIRLEQTDGGDAHKGVGNYSLDTGTLTTTLNGTPFTNTPFTFSGLQVGIKIGF